MATVTIAVMRRERFSVSAECLQRIFDHTEIPFDLVLVDCDMPNRYRQAIAQVLAGRKSASVLRADRHLLPNEGRNLAIAEARNELVCLVENDILVSERWLSGLVRALEEEDAGLVVPFLIEGRPGSKSKRAQAAWRTSGREHTARRGDLPPAGERAARRDAPLPRDALH